MRTVLLAVLTLLVVLSGSALADDEFHAVPGAGKGKKMKLRVVRYDGATNGELTVEVKNTGKTSATFDARGLYFVPDMDPAEAPQRLGAVGPMQIAGDEDGERTEKITIAAGDTVTVTLDVFCIDSHRSSPSASTPFTVGKKRMPKSLSRKVDAEGRKAAKKAGGFAAPAAKSEIQGAVWKARDADWVKLEGEGAQEDGK
jgi:hypothetical protein